METPEMTKTAIVEGLREILQLSLPHCDDGNPHEDDFIAINQMAHECLLKIRRLGVKELV